MEKSVPYKFIFNITLFLFFGVNISLQAQSPAFWQLTDEDGLPSMTIYTIKQDQQGYIWMGTSNGICRFDGKKIETYFSPELKDNEILAIDIDENTDVVWFSNLSGQLFYMKENLPLLTSSTLLKENQKLFDFKLSDNMIWIVFQENNIGENSVWKFGKIPFDANFKLGSIEIIKTSESAISSILKIEDQISIGTKTYFYSLKNGVESTIEVDAEIKNWIFKHGDYIYCHNWYDKIFAFDQTTGITKLNNQNANKKLPINLLYSIRSQLWAASRDGIIIEPFDDLNREIHFPEINFNVAFEDSEHNIWLGTLGKGVMVIPEFNLKNFENASTQIDQQVYTLYKDQKENLLLSGMDKGVLGIIDNKFSNRTIDLQQRDYTRFITKITSDFIFFGTDRAVLILDKNYKIHQERPDGLKTIFQHSNGSIFLGTPKRTALTSDRYLNPRIKRKKNKTLLPKRTYALAEDETGHLWIGTTTGIYFYKDSTTGPLVVDGKPLAINISDMKFSTDGSMWVATLGNGLYQFQNRKLINTYTKEEGLSSNACKKINLNNNKVWIATNSGVNILDIATQEFSYINKTDGLPTNEINDIAFYNDHTWLATTKGLSYFPDSTNFKNTIAPSIQITSIKIWDRDTIISDSLILDHTQNNLQIEFAGISFRSKGNNTYLYRLSGIDRDWVKTESRIIRYPKIEPGNYHFEVKAVNEDGIESKVSATFYLKIKPAWWQTVWAKILGLALGLGILFSVFYLRIKRIKQQQKQQQEFDNKISELKHLALQTQMNPHFIFNALNAIQNFLSSNDQEQAMLYLAKFARLIRSIFELSKNKIIPIEKEIDFLQNYLSLEKLRFKDKVIIQFDVSENLKKNAFDYKVPPLLIQPLIENAFKHGLFHKETTGHLIINTYLEKEHLICEISDDGIGRDKAYQLSKWKNQNYKSSGIQTTKARLQIINTDSSFPEEKFLEIIDLKTPQNSPNGTEVIIRIKCTKQ